MTRSRVASAAAALLLVWAALLVPAALAQTPSPSPSPSGSSSPSAAASSSATAAPERASMALLLSAEPATVELGDETVVVAQLSNTGNTVVDEAELRVTLPAELELVSAFPAPASSAGATHTFRLGPLDPNESTVVQLTASGSELVERAVVTATATAGDVTASDDAVVSVVATSGGPGGLVVTSRAERVLAQVGSMVRYVVTVTNEGDEDLDDVLVVDLAPEEIEVVSVDIVDEVEAVQIGESRGRYDIVWNVGSLPAGSSIELPWDGKAIRPGDLTAVNSVQGLLGQTESVRSTSRSFLADEGPRDVDNPPFEPIEKRVVTFVDPPPAPAQERAETVGGTVLPFTGSSLSGVAIAGLLLTAAGLLILGGARLVRDPAGRAITSALLAAFVLAACFGGGDDESARGAAPRTFGTDDPRDDEDARVKGERITRGEDDEATPAPSAPPATPAPPATAQPTAAPTATPAPTAPPATTAPPAVAAPPAATEAPDPEPVRVVEIVRIGLEDLPVETLGSRSGDNSISFGWDESDGVTSASSGTRFVKGNGSELLTDLTTGGGAIVNRLTLTNTNEAARLQVTGRLVHEVYSGSRLVATLRSEPIDVVLAPGGSVVARFSYLVPTGDYVVHASFEASQ